MVLDKIALGEKYINYLKKVEELIIRDLENTSKDYIQDHEFFFNRKDERDNILNMGLEQHSVLSMGETYSILTNIENMLVIVIIYKSILNNSAYTVCLGKTSRSGKIEYISDTKKHAGIIFKFFIKLNMIMKKRYKIDIKTL
jgi:hypothetical protein